MSKKNTAEQRTESNGDAEQFDRFEQLTRRLLSVPKKEADAKAAERKRDKNRLR